MILQYFPLDIFVYLNVSSIHFLPPFLIYGDGYVTKTPPQGGYQDEGIFFTPVPPSIVPSVSDPVPIGLQEPTVLTQSIAKRAGFPQC
jgi:hypothetical protein